MDRRRDASIPEKKLLILLGLNLKESFSCCGCLISFLFIYFFYLLFFPVRLDGSFLSDYGED